LFRDIDRQLILVVALISSWRGKWRGLQSGSGGGGASLEMEGGSWEVGFGLVSF
jgi:hypothetical protein